MKVLKIILLIIFFIPGCSFFSNNFNNNKIIELGSLKSNNIWVYLCGLTKEFDSKQEIENRNILDQVGQNLNLKILAIKPETRCAEFDNKLCWPHNSSEETLKTYRYILDSIKKAKNQPPVKICGFIGFSNGGFFLNKLVQIIELNKPVISIGSSGYLENTKVRNALYLIIGKQDIYHYKGAQELYNKSKKTQLNVKLIEHDGGHQIPKEIVENVLTFCILK